MKTTKLLGIVIATAAIIAATTMLTTSGTRPALAKGNCSTADDGSLTCSGGTSYKHDKGVDIPGGIGQHFTTSPDGGLTSFSGGFGVNDGEFVGGGGEHFSCGSDSGCQGGGGSGLHTK